MPIDYAHALSLQLPPLRHIYTERDTILYALGIGLGSDPTDAAQLRYVYEQGPGLQAFPTMAVILGFVSMRQVPLGIDYARMVHAEQALELFAPLPVAATVEGRTRVASIVDRGPKGALIRLERDITEADGGRLLARSAMTVLCRADGGFGGPVTTAPAVREHPTRPADRRVRLATLPQQALIYRLSGDMNPLHADPETARRAGFDRPILHGLATFGLIGRAVAEAVPDADGGSALRFLSGRFLAPVYPGDTLEVELWQEPDGWVLRAAVPERATVVFGHGLARIG